MPISIGKGRIEPIEDARHALYILGELKKKKQLIREPSSDEILQIATQISEIKNKRILDSRLKKIYELKQLDSVLQSMNLIEDADMSYFTVVNDMWDFGGLQFRSAGSQLSLKYTPGVNVFDSENKSSEVNFPANSTNYSKGKSLGSTFRNTLGLYFVSKKPIKQKFQSDFSSSVEYGIYDRKYKYEELQPGTATNESNSKSNFINTNIGYSFGIYPNTRTNFTINASIGGSKQWAKESYNSVDSDFESFYYRSLIGGEFNYYISPKLKLNFSYSIYFYKSEHENEFPESRENFNHSTNLTLLYSIF